MKALISAIGSRGDVQPLLALAVELRSLGQGAVLCVPPNFTTWVESFGIECLPIGPDVRQAGRRMTAAKPRRPSTAQLRALTARTVRDYFRATLAAARGCDLIVAGGALQVAGRSIAEALKIPYVFAAYCPAVLRSSEHAPPKIRTRIRSQGLPRLANRLLWSLDERSWNHLFRPTINEERAALDLAPIESVPRYVLTDRPWLAADPLLGPAPAGTRSCAQTGAWLLSDSAELPTALDRFLSDGEPPIYFGFGSMRASHESAPMLIGAARALGRRAILAHGWAAPFPRDGRDHSRPSTRAGHRAPRRTHRCRAADQGIRLSRCRGIGNLASCLGGFMFVAVYWWRVHEGKEEQFREAWRRGTLRITDIYGSYGSRLHRDRDGRFVGYAEWPDEATWQAAFDRKMMYDDPEARRMFVDAVAQAPPEGRPVFTMSVTDDLLRSRPSGCDSL